MIFWINDPTPHILNFLSRVGNPKLNFKIKEKEIQL